MSEISIVFEISYENRTAVKITAYWLAYRSGQLVIRYHNLHGPASGQLLQSIFQLKISIHLVMHLRITVTNPP